MSATMPAWVHALADESGNISPETIAERIQRVKGLDSALVDRISHGLMVCILSVYIRRDEQADPGNYDDALEEIADLSEKLVAQVERHIWPRLRGDSEQGERLREVLRREGADEESILRLLAALHNATETVADERRVSGNADRERKRTDARRHGAPKEGTADMAKVIAWALLERDANAKLTAKNQDITQQIFNALGAPPPGEESLRGYWTQARRDFRAARDCE